MATATASFGSVVKDAEVGSASYQEGGASVSMRGEEAPARFRRSHGILLACTSGMMISAFIYAMPNKTAKLAASDSADAETALPVDVFDVAEAAGAGLYHAPTPMPQTSSPTMWQENGFFCGSDIQDNREEYDYEVKNGEFKYNVTYYGNDCLLQTDADSNDIMAVGEDYLDVEANVTFLMGQKSSFQVSAVGLRANLDDDAPNSGFCKGYEQYLCVPLVKFSGDYGEDRIKLKLQQCGTKTDDDDSTKVSNGKLSTFAISDRVSFDYNRWYTTSFKAVGSDLKCVLYDNDSGEAIVSLSAGKSDYDYEITSSGDVHFGGYGKHFYFDDVSITDLA